MAKRKVSERDFLIEQCLYDAYCEREGVINEGFVDDFKANARAAGEWLKQDAKDSFRLRKKGEVQSNRKNAAASGKIKSYAGSLAKTMSDFKKSGGTLGRNISNIDDVINRLNLVSQGKLPRGVAGSNWAEPEQQNAYSSGAPSNTNTNSTVSSTKTTQSNSSRPSKNTTTTDNNGYFTTGASAPSPSTASSTPKNTSSNSSPTTNGSSNQSTASQQVEPAQQPQEEIGANNQQQTPTSSSETQNKPLSKRDIARKKRQEKIFKRKEREAEKAKIERAKRIKKAGKAAAKAKKADTPVAPGEPAAPVKPTDSDNPATPDNPVPPVTPAADQQPKNPPQSTPEASNSDNSTGNEDTLNADDQTSTDGSSVTADTPNTPGQSAMLDSIPDNQGTYIGDINNINQQTPWTTTIGGTQKGDAYIGGTTNLPGEDNSLPGDTQPQLPAPEEPLGLPGPNDTEDSQVEEPAEIIPAVKEDPLRGVVPNHTYSKHSHPRDENGKRIKVNPKKQARKAIQNARSAEQSRREMTRQHGTKYKNKKGSEAEEVIKEHYNTSAQMSMLNSII
ncbi:MAG: hypothetical protein IJD58_11420 [Lachnospiraceae bacterium]|nr:hypothetical protein [Lachnospiraceae bacterium]